MILESARKLTRNISRFRLNVIARRINNSSPFSQLKKPEQVDLFLTSFSQGKTAHFMFDGDDIAFFQMASPDIRASIIRDADDICNHYFNLLGSGRKKVDGGNGNLLWHFDFKVGKAWDPHAFCLDLLQLRDDGADNLVPWELSRFQHLPTLGKAYLLTGDERYVREFTSEISDWIAKNPYSRGINWRCPMEVAIRAVNWLWGYQYFRDSPLIDKAFLRNFVRSLILHGRHLRANPERNPALVEFLTSLLVSRQSLLSSIKRARAPTTNNHYLSDIAGLIYLGIMLGGIKEAESWRRLGMRELLKEMAKQVYPDGVAYEGSTAYHHLQAEIFLSTTIILQKNGFKLPEWYLKRLEKMLEFTRYYTRPDGNAPQIGDSDDGRLHILSRYGEWNKRDHRHLLAVGAVVFNRPDLRQGDEDEEAVLWLCGKGGVTKYRNMTSPAPNPSSLAFHRAGFYVLRKDALYMTVDCIQDDALAPRGHRHNSRLSFELYAYDRAFIVDPGTYTYVDGEGMRDMFRSTGYHNTVTVDGEEQNRFRQPRFVQDLFDMYNDARVMVREWASNEEYDFLDAEHSGYQRLEIPVRHRRQIWFDKVTPCWIIKDILSSQGKHDYVLALHFAPMELEIGRKPPQYVKTGSDGANIMVLFPASEREEISLAEGWVSPSYGVRHRAPVVHRALRGQSAVFYTVIYPYQREVGISKIMARVGSSSLLGGIGIRLGRTPSTRRKTKREAGE